MVGLNVKGKCPTHGKTQSPPRKKRKRNNFFSPCRCGFFAYTAPIRFGLSRYCLKFHCLQTIAWTAHACDLRQIIATCDRSNCVRSSVWWAKILCLETRVKGSEEDENQRRKWWTSQIYKPWKNSILQLASKTFHKALSRLIFQLFVWWRCPELDTCNNRTNPRHKRNAEIVRIEDQGHSINSSILDRLAHEGHFGPRIHFGPWLD